MAGERIGVLGGTFDPIHIGHLILAQEAYLQLWLDYVLIVPAGDPWRKAGHPVSAREHRLAMARLAAEVDARLRVSTIETEREGPSYSADTLEALRQLLDPQEIYFIMGEDALFDLPNWHQPQRIIAAAVLAVAGRPGWAMPSAGELEELVPGLSRRVTRIDMPMIDISATWLRERARRGLPLRYLTLDSVADYIRTHRLYTAD